MIVAVTSVIRTTNKRSIVWLTRSRYITAEGASKLWPRGPRYVRIQGIGGAVQAISAMDVVD